MCIRDRLNRLQQEQIVDYKPSKDKPQLIFLQERVAAENMTIDRDLYEFRKNRSWQNIKASINYASTLSCRSKMLLAYFGETSAAPCGICDFCLGRHITDLSNKEYLYFKKRIRELLESTPLKLDQLAEKFSRSEEPKALKTIEYLLDNNFLQQLDDETFSWNI